MSGASGGIGGLPPVAASGCEVAAQAATGWCSSATGHPVVIITQTDGNGTISYTTIDLDTGQEIANGPVVACGERDWEVSVLCDVDQITGHTFATVVQIFMWDEQSQALTRSLERADQPGVQYVPQGALQSCSGGQLQAITELVCATDVSNDSTQLTAVILVDTLDGTVRHTYYLDAEGNIVTIAGGTTLTVGLCPGTSTVTGSVMVTNFPASTEISNDTGNPIPVSGSVSVSNPGLTDGELRASPVDVQGSVSVSNLPAVQPVSGTVSVGNFPASTEIANDVGNPIPVSGSVAVTNPGLTDTQLRATPVPVSGTVTVTDGSGPLTVDGSVTVSNFPATQSVSGTVNIGTAPEIEVKNDAGNPLAVSGTVTVSNPTAAGLTDTQLRATPVGVTDATLVSVVKLEDVPAVSGDPGIQVLGVRNDTGATKTSTDGDYSTMSTDAAGRVAVTTLGGTLTTADANLKAQGAISGEADATSGTINTAVQLPAHAAVQGVMIQAAITNTGIVYLGFAATVTAANAPIILQPGDVICVPITNSNLLWSISPVVSQRFGVSAV